MTKSELIETAKYAGIGSVIAVVAAWFAFAPHSSSSGGLTDALVYVAGNAYAGRVACGPREKPTGSPMSQMAKGFLGQHEGKRVTVYGWTRRDARQRLEARHPDCRTSLFSRQRRKSTGLHFRL